MKWKEHQIASSIDELDMSTGEYGFSGIAELLQKLKPGEFYKETIPKGINELKAMERYIKGLQGAGLDIGKGDAAFGYKMPLPEKNKVGRDLIIFRRN
jgi:hypothetical protein